MSLPLVRRVLPAALGVATLAASLASAQATAGTTGSNVTLLPCVDAAPPDSLVVASAGGNVFVDNGAGIIAMEVESAPTNSNWVEEDVLAGFSGDSYYRWNGPNFFDTPGIGILEYDFVVDAAGLYQLRIHNRHDNPEPSEENDVWVRMDGGEWEKCFSNTPILNQIWNWESKFESTGGNASFNLAAGAHTLQISARSFNMKIDRVHVYLSGTPNPSTIFQPLSPTQSATAVIGQSIDIEMDDPTNAALLNPAASFALLMAGLPGGSYPCGTSLPGFGMLGGNGEFFLTLTPTPIALGLQVWTGPGNPATFSLNIPNSPSLVGKALPIQGLFADAGTFPASPFALTQGLELTIGDR